jgi:hypothetical protein
MKDVRFVTRKPFLVIWSEAKKVKILTTYANSPTQSKARHYP